MSPVSLTSRPIFLFCNTLNNYQATFHIILAGWGILATCKLWRKKKQPLLLSVPLIALTLSLTLFCLKA